MALISPELIFPDLRCHMPFLTYIGGQEWLFFVTADGPIEVTKSQNDYYLKLNRRRLKQAKNNYIARYVPWRLAYCNLLDKEIHFIDPHLATDSILCSPAVDIVQDHVFLSFVGGQWVSDRSHIAFHLYHLRGDSLQNLYFQQRLTDDPTFAGYDNHLHRIYSHKHNSFYLLYSNQITQFNTTFGCIYRITYYADDLYKLLITGEYEGQERTVVFDLHTGSIQEVRANDEPVYKCTILQDKLIWAKKTGPKSEDRQLVIGSPQYCDTPIQILN